jgi:hypothetical protein
MDIRCEASRSGYDRGLELMVDKFRRGKLEYSLSTRNVATVAKLGLRRLSQFASAELSTGPSELTHDSGGWAGHFGKAACVGSTL